MVMEARHLPVKLVAIITTSFALLWFVGDMTAGPSFVSAARCATLGGASVADSNPPVCMSAKADNSFVSDSSL